MSRSTSNHGNQNRNPAEGYLDDNEHLRASNSDHMFNALMDQYLSNASSSTPATSTAYASFLRRHHTDPQSALPPFQQVTSPSVGHVHASRSPSWSLAAPNPAYGPFDGGGQVTLSNPGSNTYLHGGEQPSFADLMRELSHEQSRALHEAARSAPLSPVCVLCPLRGADHTTPTLSNPQQMSYPGERFYTLPSDLPQPSSHHASRSSSVSLSGGSIGGQQRAVNVGSEDDSLFEMFPCDMCTASFSRRHDLERHRRGHSGEAPYTCEGCGGGFTRSDGRGRHWKLQPACEARHFERGGSGKRRSGAPLGTTPA